MISMSLSRNIVHTGHLILVNRDYPYREETPHATLTPVAETSSNVLLERSFASAYDKLMDELDARKGITAVSGWRSRQEQEKIYCDSLISNGDHFTANYVALPGHSEHQTGLAVDLALNQPDIDFIRPYFPYTGVCGAFREIAGRYGLIMRYPEGKEHITGIAYEPWHFRYVSALHAMIMEQTGDTLEEYHARIKQFPYGRASYKVDFEGLGIEISYLSADKEITTLDIEDDTPYSISGNNMDGFVFTVWRVGKR